MFSFFTRLSMALLLMLAVSAQANAMTVYDVIQLSKKGYADEDVIALIEVTDSAFELQADDIPRLVELGVSEPVIQTMLKAVPAEPAPDAAPGQYVDSKPVSETVISYGTVDKPAPRADINSEPLEEPGSGGHHHQVITLSGIRLFVLRDEGGYSSVAARASVVADRLREASAVDGGQFQPAHVAGGDVVLFTAPGVASPVTVVSVSARDARAYQQRSGRRVTTDLLAAYWSALMSDYWSLALDGQAPARLARLHEGEALQELFDGLDTSVKNTADRLTGALQSLPVQEQEHLSRLATSVPRDFEAIDEHAGETP